MASVCPAMTIKKGEARRKSGFSYNSLVIAWFSQLNGSPLQETHFEQFCFKMG